MRSYHVTIGHFRVSKPSLWKWGQVLNLSCENEFYLHENEKSFHIKGWALNLVLKQRPGVPGNGLLTHPYCPVHTYGYLWIWIILETDFLFSLLAFHLHLNGVFGHLERRFLKKGPQEGDLKTPASHLCVDGRNRRFSISCIITSITHALYGMLSYFSRFSFFMWTGVNESNTLRSLSDTRGQGYRAFHMRGEHWNKKKKRFQKNRPQPRQDCLGTPSWL